jgi:serine/threonine protein kinase
MDKIFKALNYVHSAGIIHHDIKLENIMFKNKDDYSSLVIIDFGLSQKSSNLVMKISGTPGYMAPEIWNLASVDSSLPSAKKYDRRIDMFSCGIIYFYL